MAEDRARRLHRFTGAVLLGLFLVEHLLTNASALGGEAAYDRVVGAIERSPILPLVEVVFILVPLSLHVALGVRFLRRPAAAASEAHYGDPRFLLIQRVSAALLLLFVAFHLWELRLQRLFFGLHARSLYTVLSARLSWTWAGVPWVSIVYLVGVALAALHFANGLSAALRAVRPERGRSVRAGTIALGVALFAVGAATVIGLATGTRLPSEPEVDSAPCGPSQDPPSP